MAVALICGAIVFSACTSNDDNPTMPDLNVAEKIMGKWIKSDQNGQPLPTDGKMVYTFVSPTKAYMSASIDASPGTARVVGNHRAQRRPDALDCPVQERRRHDV